MVLLMLSVWDVLSSAFIHYNGPLDISSLASGHGHMHLHVGIVVIFINVCNASRICPGHSSFMQEFSMVQVFVGLPLKLADPDYAILSSVFFEQVIHQNHLGNNNCCIIFSYLGFWFYLSICFPGFILH
jgi:hypothetical protein